MNNTKVFNRNKQKNIELVQYKSFTYRRTFVFQEGETLPEFTLRYETYGQLNAEKSNAILICHALSGDHHCAGIYHLQSRKKGWWDHIIGLDKPIDTNKYFVICSNCLGGCQGSSGPSSINPQTNQRYNLSFPSVSIEDMVRAQRCLIDHLGITSLHCVIGGSMGGMQALQWAILFPDMVRKIIAMATTARHSAQAIAFNAVGRSAIMQDTQWEAGNYPPEKGPEVGLAVARMMAHITYLSDRGMENKFGRNRRNNSPQSDIFDNDFEVEHYLRYQGKSFVSRFDANSYLYLTRAVDRFDLYGEEGHLEDSMSKIKARTLIIGFSSDWLYTPEQNRTIVHALLRCGKQASYAHMAMEHGHDSFLVHSPELYHLVNRFLLVD